MFTKLAKIQAEYERLSQQMADPAIATDHKKLGQLARQQAETQPIVDTYRRYLAVQKEIEEAKLLAGEPEMATLVAEEVTQLQAEAEQLTAALKTLLLPKDPHDKKNVIVEIRAGTGGDEAGLFAADLFRMYSRYADGRGWKVKILNANETGIGGFKEIIFEVKGKGAYSRLKYESGVHRVQRVPQTETQGRIHTSTATVAVLPEMDDIEIEIKPQDIRVDIFRSSGPGGQSVNTTDSAVRITHLSSGIVISMQDEKSQLQNKIKAMSVLRAKLFALAEEKRRREVGDKRRSMVGSGERSEKIRTYNFPQNRVTDHRIGLTLHKLDAILDGDLDGMIDVLAMEEQASTLQAL